MKKAPPPSPAWFSIERRLEAIASSDVVMPVDEIRLANDASKLADASVHVADFERWARHANFHVRRVGVNTLRRLGTWNDVFLERLSDANGWVRCDAALAVAATGKPTPGVIAALTTLAAGQRAPTVEEEDTLDIDDEDLMARVEAAKALELIRSR